MAPGRRHKSTTKGPRIRLPDQLFSSILHGPGLLNELPTQPAPFTFPISSERDQKPSIPNKRKMADVEMTDAPPTKAKKVKEGAEDKKPRFEVKKVCGHASWTLRHSANLYPVECRCAVGLGHCCRQLRHLP